MEKASFIFYESYLEAIKGMDGDTAKATLLAIGRYALEGKKPRGLSPWAKSVFAMAKPLIDANAERYEKSLAGGRPPHELPPQEELEAMRQRLGGWDAVAEELGVSKATLSRRRRAKKPQDECQNGCQNGCQNSKPNVHDNENVHENVNENVHENVNENVNENENENEEREGARSAPAEPPAPPKSSNSSSKISAKNATAQAAAPPTREEVDALCKERGYTFDPGTFFAYYAATGWRSKGGAKIADWRSCAELWEKRERKDEGAARRGARASLAPVAVQREQSGWHAERTVL